MKLKIQPWPFRKDEEVELYWLCSPFFNSERGWLMKAVFKKASGAIKEIIVPWGTIPAMIIGQKYVNGMPSTTGKRGMILEISIPLNVQIEICNSFDIPSPLCYLYKNHDYGNQKICKFSIEHRKIYIPCLEVVRTYLVPHKVLANCIMKPSGLGLLIGNADVKGKDLFIEFTDELPRNVVCDETAAYLAWLKYDLYANKSWNSIYNKVFSKAIEKSPYSAVAEFQRGTYIEVLPPIGRGTKWTFRGITVGKDTLILELLSRTNLYMKFDNIYYSHPSLINPELSNERKLIKIDKSRGKENQDQANLDQSGEPSKKDGVQPTTNHISIGFSFSKNPTLKKVRKKNEKLRTGIPVDDASIRAGIGNGDDEGTVSTQDWVYGGKIKPIEFKTLELVRDGIIKGLEGFLKVIEYIDQNYNGFRLSLNLFYVPKGKAFSSYPDSMRRNCAIVKIERKNKLPCYILEIGRADGWSISTLIVYQLTERILEEEIEEMLSGLFNGLISNNGHWDKQSIEREIRFRFDMLKHVSGQEMHRWSSRILNKMLSS